MYSVSTSTTSEGGIGLENGAIERTREIERKVNDRMEKFKTETNARHRESMNSMAQLKSTKEAMKDMDLDLAILESSILQSLDELREIYKKIVLSSSSSSSSSLKKHIQDETTMDVDDDDDDGQQQKQHQKENEDEETHRAPRMNENPFASTAAIDSAEVLSMDEGDEKQDQVVAMEEEEEAVDQQQQLGEEDEVMFDESDFVDNRSGDVVVNDEGGSSAAAVDGSMQF